MSDWFLNPLTQYGAIGLGLVICVVVFISLKVEIALVRRMLKEAPEPATAVAAEAAPAPTPVPVLEPVMEPHLPGPAINLTTRAQAVRMLNRGESISTIASALRAPTNEIELIHKLQRVLDRQEPAIAGLNAKVLPRIQS